MTSGDRAWIGLAVYVAVYDAVALVTGRDTLSQSYARAMSDGRRWPTLALWAVIMGHLTGALPRKYDPMRRIEVAKLTDRSQVHA